MDSYNVDKSHQKLIEKWILNDAILSNLSSHAPHSVGLAHVTATHVRGSSQPLARRRDINGFPRSVGVGGLHAAES